MPRLFAVLTLSILTATAPISVYSEEGTAMTEDQKAALGHVESMTAAFHDGDIEGVMSSYEPKAMVLFEPGAAITDPAVLREMFQGAFTVNPRFEYSGHEVYVMGDIAVHFAPWSMTGQAPDGTAVKDSGLSVAVMRRQEDGRWLIVFDNPHGQRLMTR